MKIKVFTLIAIIFLSGFVRIYHLNILPPSLFYDEIDAGYQAQNFNQNKTDYYGNKFPIHFHSFGDFRTSLYIYSISLIKKIIPDLDVSIRLPSAIFGVLSVFIIYLITKSLIPSFLVAISPWAIHYSRIGFEASGMLLFIFLGIYFWQKFLKKSNTYNLYLSIFFFCLSPYFYSTAKLFLIFIALTIFFISYKKIFLLGIKQILLLITFSIIILLPLSIDTFQGKAGFRFQYISIFTQPHNEQIVDKLRFEDASIDHPNQLGIKTTFVSRLSHNKYQLILDRFVKNYFSSFSTNFLFLSGDSNIRHGFGGNYGLLYFQDVIFILLGLFSFFSEKKKTPLSLLFFWLLIFAPIPSSLTRDTDSSHATRLITMLPSLIYFSYLGINSLIKKRKLFKYLIFIIYTLSFLNFYHYYKYHYPNQSAMEWGTGIKETIIASQEYPQSTLVYSNDYTSFVSFFLYYFPYPLLPDDSLQNHLSDYSNNSFSGQILDNKYYFGQVNWSNTSEIPLNAIYIVPKSEYQAKSLNTFEILNTISKKYTNQEEFYIIKPKK